MSNNIYKGSLEQGIQENIDRLGSDSKQMRMSAELNRDLIAVFDNYFERYPNVKLDGTEVILAVFNGISTILGTALLQADKDKQRKVFDLMKKETIKCFDIVEENLL